MEGFKFKLHTNELKFELEIDKIELEKEKSFVKEILKMIDRKSATMVEKMNKEDIKDNIKDLAKGYKLHENLQHGMNFMDEFLIEEAEEEMGDEEKEKTNTNTSVDEQKEDIEQETDNKNSTTENNVSKEEEYRKKDLSIRMGSGNEKLYQTFYICPKCKDKNKKYIPRYAFEVECRNCFNTMRKRNASLKGFPNKDKYGNIFVAGSFEVNEDTQINEEN
ncbi:hypothetical protein AAGG74_15850 [Bacillus mexicanus]|uniref:hypothetical protein n=1 Tax=Bacillus mexicanus TaxID=2834415 RepID=UPI003D1F8180